MDWKHIGDHDPARHYLGMVKDEAELATLEEHVLACARCAGRADETLRRACKIASPIWTFACLSKLKRSRDWSKERGYEHTSSLTCSRSTDPL